MSEPLHIISLGAGVQSSTLRKMAERGAFGDIPVMSVFSDTQDETGRTYEYLGRLKEDGGIMIRTVSRGHLAAEQLRLREFKNKPGQFWAKSLIPAYILNADGTKGIMGRQCTFSYKVEMLERNARAVAGSIAIRAWRKRHQQAWDEWKESKAEGRVCESWAWDEMQSDPLIVQWIGISLDEPQRMKPARQPWIKHRWPLIEAEMTRHDCKEVYRKENQPEPPRSACYYCPFHNDNEWRSIRDNDPVEFQKAVQFEKQLQGVKAITDNIKGIPFLHASLQPLGDVDFSTDTERGQGMLAGFGNECEGMCGV